MKSGKTLSFFVLIALIPTLPFAWVGYAGHDVHLHLSSWMEIRDAWLSGRFWPGWDSLSNFTLGDPHFDFYPPLSFLLGAVLSTILPLRIAPAAFVSVLTLVSGLTMYEASKAFVAENDRVKAALLYMLSPYLLTTAIVRFAASELMVQAWLPLICLAFYRLMWNKDNRSLLMLGGLLGLSWLTSIPASIVLLYGLGIVAVVTSIRRRLVRPILGFLIAEAIASLLAAFYLVPVYVEQKWITPTGLSRYTIREFMLFAPISTLTRELFTVSCWAIACAGIVLVSIHALTRDRNRAGNEATRTWWELALVSFGFQLPFTLPLWRHLPELSSVAFAFRFLVLLGVALPLALLGKGTRRSLRLPTYAVVAIMSLMPFLVIIRAQIPWRTYPEFETMMSRWAQVGKHGMPEFVPRGVIQPTAPTGIPAVTVLSNTSTAHCSADPQMRGPALTAVQIDADGPCQLRLRTYYYPYWHVVDESGKLLTVGRDGDGLILVSAPAGKHLLTLDFEARSSLRTAALIVSVVSAMFLGLAMFVLTHVRNRQYERVLAPVA